MLDVRVRCAHSSLKPTFLPFTLPWKLCQQELCVDRSFVFQVRDDDYSISVSLVLLDYQPLPGRIELQADTGIFCVIH
jgi:hypothetical protein